MQRSGETARLISSYVGKDPTAFCSYEDHQLAVRTLEQVCLLRAESVEAAACRGYSCHHPGTAGGTGEAGEGVRGTAGGFGGF